MADTAVTGANVVFLSKNTAVATAALGQSVTTGNTGVLTPQAGSLTGGGVGTPGNSFKGRYMLVRMVPTANSTVTFSAASTSGTPANLATLGDLVVTLTGTTEQTVQLDLGRFIQANGTVRAVVGGTGPVAITVLNLSKSA